ncbi:GNAT family N-acetyltransferase [Clostridium gasigenes]|uniref:GNAT family N-acetyltransferase n=1 Tax=Clostridium gasigenes TaxID=94869 RepID=UPI0014385D5C|nr:GNAT family N-acetyltransferase [Clostridium gasigenes]NKF05719.1 GNAT family N-acetyltransferase [Clostridium gasigenes]QSW19152.1 GNAT family N-acetyltransferase [Clostridium gasigenes]
MIIYREIDKSYFKKYDSIPMLVHVKSILKLEKVKNGLGGILLKETSVKEYIRDLGEYEEATKYAKEFDISNWAFFMAFDNEVPIGAVTVASKTKNVNMLDGREDMSVLWDIRVDDRYKQQGIGTKLFSMAVEWSKLKQFKQMKIECQNNNVQACRFYHKHGVVLGKIDEYAYYNDTDVEDEVQLIWYLDL